MTDLAADRGEPEVVIRPDESSAAADAAARIAASLADAVARRGRADWATTGGSTPIPVYRHLTAEPLRDAVPWDRVHVWWGDDRVVPRDHPLSNRLPFDEVLLPGVGPIPMGNIHAMPIDLAIGRTSSPDEAAREAAVTYESALRAAPLARDADGFPILDIVFVGIGPDGHVLSVFPGSPLFDATGWVEPVPAPSHVEPHVARVSLHPAILAAARLPLTVVLGSGKAEIVRAILEGPRDVRRLPSQLARRAGAVWVLDAAAGSRLRPGTA